MDLLESANYHPSDYQQFSVAAMSRIIEKLLICRSRNCAARSWTIQLEEGDVINGSVIKAAVSAQLSSIQWDFSPTTSIKLNLPKVYTKTELKLRFELLSGKETL